MLGEMLAEGQGKITGMRVLPDSKVELSFQGNSRALGVEGTDTGTWVTATKQGGVLSTKGQGFTMTKDGEIVTWTEEGVGKPTGPGSASSWRTSMFCQTASQKLGRLNSVAFVSEVEVDENGNYHYKMWEWK